MTPRYIEGWNDRILKRSEDYGKAYRSVGGELLANCLTAEVWTREERGEYVRGWNEADQRIRALVIVGGVKARP